MSNEYNPKHLGTRTLFRKSWLEKLSRTHISVPLIIFFTYAGVLLFWSISATALAWTTTTLMFAAGLIFWTLLEYLVHRFVFHYNEGSSVQYTIHGVHHEYPKDKSRLAMPPVISIALATLLFALFRFLLGDAGFAFTAGFLCGYALYLCIHYVVHIYPPPKNRFNILWINHSLHHYREGGYCFGVSSPLWDFVFGTMHRR